MNNSKHPSAQWDGTTSSLTRTGNSPRHFLEEHHELAKCYVPTDNGRREKYLINNHKHKALVVHTKMVFKVAGQAQREHPTQIMVEELSREFAKARKKSGFYDHLEEKAHPTFHEIRSLGSDLKRKAGWKDEAIQQLMAHSDKGMTEHYMNKHEMPWTEVNSEQD